MNNTKIDWATRSWNPVTGCLHGCPYCYARKIAERFGTLFKGPQPEDEGLTFLPDEPERFKVGKNTRYTYYVEFWKGGRER